MSQSPLTLPIIDFTELTEGSPKWNSVKAQVKEALKEYGCFEALFPKISIQVRKALFGYLGELFDLPLETKIRSSSKKHFNGYIGQIPMLPLYESMGIDDPLVGDKVESFLKLLWPEGNPDLCKSIQSYSEQLSELDQTVRRMILESLGLESYLDEHLNSTNYLLRVMNYKGPETTETKLGLKSHRDKNTVTILYNNQIEGLEVQIKNGEWINVTPSPDSFTVMIGDSLHAWTNGIFHSPYHRVMMRGNEARYSAGLFSMPKEGYIIKAPEELIDDKHPLLFKPYDNVKFLEFFYTEAGQKAHDPFKTYCGV